MEINLQRLKALIQKEFIQLWRDWRLLLFILGLPILELILYGYAASLTVYHLPMAVVDQSNDPKSREFIRELVNSQFFDIAMRLNNQGETIQAIDRGDVKIGLIIPPHFASNQDRGKADVLFLLDGSDNTSVQSGYNAAALIVQNDNLQMVTREVSRTSAHAMAGNLPISNSTTILYDPNLIDIWFILPGLVGLVLQTLAITQAVLIVVRDREIGTIEPILSTPARPIEIMLSKMSTLLALCLAAMGIVLAIGIFWFGVPFRGSLILYFLLALLFIASSLGLGLLLSTQASTQKEATQYGMMFMLVGILMSGFMYPLNNMPVPLQMVSALFPVTYFIRISRGIFLKGVGINFVWSDALILLIYCLVIIFLAAKSFKQRLD